MQKILHRFSRWLALALAAALVLGLAGCGDASNSFTWFVEEIPSNLDPQVASAPADVIACKNLYGGLLRLGPDGQLQNDLCESWSVSADGLRYTFTLRDGLTYTAAKGEPTDYAITAEDFVYAFQRVFLPETRSPYAAEFSALENAAAILAGQMDVSALGVSAPDERTVVFTLSQPDDGFAHKLTLPGAMPCDEEFFLSTRGTYGLTASSTLSSGSFYLYNWTSSGLFLWRAADGTRIDSLRLVQNTSAASQTAEELILGERCSAALDDTAAPTALRSISYSDTTWCLVFNCEALDSALLRQALSAAALDADYQPDSALYTAAQGLVPDGLTVDGLDYREQAGNAMPSLGDAAGLYRSALAADPALDLAGVTILLPTDSGLISTAEQINSFWQKELSLFFSVEEAEAADFAQRLAEGDYTIALVPVTAESNSVYGLLSQFSPEGLTRYDNPHFAALLDQSLNATGAARCALLAQAEAQLVDDCALLPLFAQQKRLLIADGVEGLVFDPYGPLLDLTYTTRE